MINLSRVSLVCFIIALSLPSHGQETVYISDVLFVPLRTGQSIEYRIINAAMKSGTRLQRLEQSNDGEWSRVLTESGTEGWIRNQYLVEEKTSALKLNDALTQLARVEKNNTALKQQNTSLTESNRELAQSSQQTSRSNSQLSRELEKIKQLSASTIELERNYQELLQKHEMTQTQRDSLLAENENLKNDKRLSFLLYGAGILIVGMLLTVLLPVLKPKKSHSEWR